MKKSNEKMVVLVEVVVVGGGGGGGSTSICTTTPHHGYRTSFTNPRILPVGRHTTLNFIHVQRVEFNASIVPIIILISIPRRLRHSILEK